MVFLKSFMLMVIGGGDERTLFYFLLVILLFSMLLKYFKEFVPASLICWLGLGEIQLALWNTQLSFLLVEAEQNT